MYGQIYKAVFLSNEKIDRLDKNPLQESLNGFKTAVALSKESDTYYTLSQYEIQNLYNALLNKGTDAYQKANYSEAIKWFDKSKAVFPKDTIAYLYAGISAQAIKNDKVAYKNYTQLAELGSNQPLIYNSIIFYAENLDNDNLKALEWSDKALKKFPNNTDILKKRVTLLIKTNQYEKAKDELLKAIKIEPKNDILYFNLGYLYEITDQNSKAIEAYNKSISLNPNNFNAQYNTGVFYFNQATELYKKANDLSLKEYGEKGKAIEDKAKEFLKKALPYMEKASEIKPDDPYIFNTLSGLYLRLGMDVKAKAAQDKYDELMGY